MRKKLYIKTWGCQMNEYDSSKISDVLNHTGNYITINEPNKADILILNTCSIREKAQEKLFHQLGRWKKLKESNSNLIICVGGCVASQEGEYIFQRANYVDIIFGPQTIHRLPSMLETIYNDGKPIIDISFLELEKFDHFPTPYSNSPIASVSIMEGCDKYCAFCIVPYTRGEEVSRSCDSIITEIIELTYQGVREVNLLGQNVNAYHGVDGNGNICTFAELLRLVASIVQIERIRFISSHPIDFTDDIIDVYRDTPKLVSFLHLPVQSGSDRILALMKRGYTILDYTTIINKLKIVRPNIQISSDFIIGFPSETQQDFEQTLKLVKNINFDMSFSFIYSPRPGTPAINLSDKSSEYEKKQRLYILQNLIYQQSIQWSRRMLGTTQRILVEKISQRNLMELSGRTENNRVVHFEGTKDMIGKFVTVKISNVYTHSLRGILLINKN
ncbi:tRNA (N6-isopentenyl adenosine(37)-C2)-methylthiotransferase MiaB [Pantoea sp. Mhis]|nr:tRNA (N6-isopentenyl adenosine(37)-C2)-methylthiotransferase MiaB [Pantoea sp. Mhis]